MKSLGLVLGMSLLLLLQARSGTAQTKPAVESKAPPARGGEVTLKGLTKDDAAYGSTKFRIAVDATPEEVAEMEKAAGK